MSLPLKGTRLIRLRCFGFLRGVTISSLRFLFIRALTVVCLSSPASACHPAEGLQHRHVRADARRSRIYTRNAGDSKVILIWVQTPEVQSEGLRSPRVTARQHLKVPLKGSKSRGAGLVFPDRNLENRPSGHFTSEQLTN